MIRLSKRSIIAIGGACVAFALLLMLPRLQGARADAEYGQRIQALLRSASESGADGVPLLVNVLFAARTTVSELAPKERVKWALFVGDLRAVSILTEQLTAAEELKVHGTNACRAVPALIRLAKRDTLSGQMAIEVIAAAGCDSSEVVEGLVHFAAENRHDNSFVAVEVLASLASGTPRIERQLLTTLERTDDLRLANTILFVFRLSGFKDSDAVPILQRYAEYEETKDHALAALKGAHAISN